MPQPAIRTARLSRDFATVRAVDDLTLEIPAGTVFGFLGPNGAGKTTTIRLLLGLVEPTAGEATVLGFDTRRDAQAIRERTGALLEHTGLYERLSAEDNLELYGRIAHLSAGERRARTRELLGHFGLWERRREPAGTWSHGMKKKLAVARALIHRPALVFLDEPSSGLDPESTVALREQILALAEREGMTVFLTTHNLAEAEKVCGLVGMIRSGRLVALGAPSELGSRAREPRVTIAGRALGEPVAARLRERPEVARVTANAAGTQLTIDLRDARADHAALVSAVVLAGGEILEVRRAAATLEETYLALMDGAAAAAAEPVMETAR